MIAAMAIPELIIRWSQVRVLLGPPRSPTTSNLPGSPRRIPRTQLRYTQELVRKMDNPTRHAGVRLLGIPEARTDLGDSANVLMSKAFGVFRGIIG